MREPSFENNEKRTYPPNISMSDDTFQYGLSFQWDDRLLAEKAFDHANDENLAGKSSYEILQTHKAQESLTINNALMGAGWTPLQPNLWVSRRDNRDKLLFQISALVHETVQFRSMHRVHIFGLASAPLDLLRALDPDVPL